MCILYSASRHRTSEGEPGFYMKKKNVRILKSKREISRRVQELANEIKSVMPRDTFTVVGVLDDAFIFLADLIRALNSPLHCHFMRITREEHDDQIDVIVASEFNPRGLDILLVAAVADTGITLDYAARALSESEAKSVRTCVLLNKPDKRRVDIKPNFVAFETSEQHVFGYGLGLQNQFRQLPYLAVIEH
jgi:hypoxanthine phosphoribosyltransferase